MVKMKVNYALVAYDYNGNILDFSAYKEYPSEFDSLLFRDEMEDTYPGKFRHIELCTQNFIDEYLQNEGIIDRIIDV